MDKDLSIVYDSFVRCAKSNNIYAINLFIESGVVSQEMINRALWDYSETSVLVFDPIVIKILLNNGGILPINFDTIIRLPDDLFLEYKPKFTFAFDLESFQSLPNYHFLTDTKINYLMQDFNVETMDLLEVTNLLYLLAHIGSDTCFDYFQKYLSYIIYYDKHCFRLFLMVSDFIECSDTFVYYLISRISFTETQTMLCYLHCTIFGSKIADKENYNNTSDKLKNLMSPVYQLDKIDATLNKMRHKKVFSLDDIDICLNTLNNLIQQNG